jgi:hypothetical protein
VWLRGAHFSRNLVVPAALQHQERLCLGTQFFQRLSGEARDETNHQPSANNEFNHRYDRASLVEGDENRLKSGFMGRIRCSAATIVPNVASPIAP